MKPIIRTLHHAACTGGTLISKIVRDNLGACVLSEINPGYLFGTGNFDPSNLLSHFSHANDNNEACASLAIQAYNDNLRKIIEMLPAGSPIVVRDWSHGDFFAQLSRSPKSTICG